MHTDPYTGEILFQGRWFEPGSEELAQAREEHEDAQERQAEERAEQLREEREDRLDD